MPTTVVDMRRRIAKEIKRGSISASTTAVQNAIRDACQFYETRRFGFNEFVDSSHVTTADSPLVTLTSTLNIVRVDNIKLTIGTRFYPLARTTYRNIDSIDSDQWSGYPEYWAWFDEKLRLYPIPNDAYTLHISGVKRLEHLNDEAASADSSTATNAWAQEGEEMIRCHAKGIIFRDHVRNTAQADIMFREAERKFRQINKETWGKLRSGVVQATKF